MRPEERETLPSSSALPPEKAVSAVYCGPSMRGHSLRWGSQGARSSGSPAPAGAALPRPPAVHACTCTAICSLQKTCVRFC